MLTTDCSETVITSALLQLIYGARPLRSLRPRLATRW